MKKAISSVLAIVLALVLTASALAAGDTQGLSQEGWDRLYSSLCEENTLPMLCVGADETQLNLVWHADKGAQAKVKLAKTPDMAAAVEFSGETSPAETESQVVCRVTMTGIEPNTAYYYSIMTDNGWSEAYAYTSKAVDSYKAVVVGDIQINESFEGDNLQSQMGYTYCKLLDEALAKNPDIGFLLSPGDNTSTGKGSREWQTLLMPPAMRSLPVALAIGNHDKKGFTYDYYTNMPNEYYGKYFEELDRDFYFTYGDVLYLFFDATSGSAADHMAMAKQAVAENPDCKWRIAVMHQALYGAGYSMLSAETQILLNAVFSPIFDIYDVDLVLTGHSHLQGRSKFIYKGLTVGDAVSGQTYKNPKGSIYLNSNAVSDPGSFDMTPSYLAYDFKENDVGTYTTLDFTSTTLKIKTFRGDNSELLDSLTIEKTDGDRNDNSILNRLSRLGYKVVELLGLLYQRIDNVVVKIRGGHF